MLIARNLASRNYQAGIPSAGTASLTLQGNTVRSQHGDCIAIGTGGGLVAGSLAMDCRVSGIDSRSPGSTVRNSRVGGSFRIGIRTSGTGAMVAGNPALANRHDFCDTTGTATVTATNRFRTVSCP